MRDSKIQWCHHTFNPWWGCAKVSAECTRCYAEAFAKRTGHAVWGEKSTRRLFGDKHWNEPLKWDRMAKEAGERHRVFCASMADIFEGRDDLTPHRARLWDLIESTEHLDWLLLTKRPENAHFMVPAAWMKGWPKNIWFGTTIGHVDSMHRLQHMDVPAAVKFISAEPLLGPLSFSDGPRMFPYNRLAGIDWLIIGGESGGGARECKLEWIAKLIAEAYRAGVAPFVKQLGVKPTLHGKPYPLRLDHKGGEPADWPRRLRVRDFPKIGDC